jgi:hypothetical protein
MDIFELLRDENRAMLDEIRRLVIDYKTINNAEDIERSRHIFEILNEYIVIQNKMLYPKLPRQGEEDESIRTSKALLDEMDNIFEKSVMMHVDEPNLQYVQNLERLYNVLEAHFANLEERVYPLLRDRLDSRDIEQLNHFMNRKKLMAEMIL